LLCDGQRFPDRALSASVRKPSANDGFILGGIWLYNLLLPDDRLQRALDVRPSAELGRTLNRAVRRFPKRFGRWIVIQRERKWASFHLGRNLALQFAPAGLWSGGFQEVSGRWIVIQREQKCKAISVALK